MFCFQSRKFQKEGKGAGIRAFHILTPILSSTACRVGLVFLLREAKAGRRNSQNLRAWLSACPRKELGFKFRAEFSTTQRINTEHRFRQQRGKRCSSSQQFTSESDMKYPTQITRTSVFKALASMGLPRMPQDKIWQGAEAGGSAVPRVGRVVET